MIVYEHKAIINTQKQSHEINLMLWEVRNY